MKGSASCYQRAGRCAVLAFAVLLIVSATFSVAVARVGDCNGDGVVTVAEAALCVTNPFSCPACDGNGDSMVSASEKAEAQTNAATDACEQKPGICPTPTAMTGTSAALQAGDCNGDGVVSVQEAANCAAVAAGSFPLGGCGPCDADHNGVVSVAEVIVAEQNAIADACMQQPGACPPTPTVTETSAASPTPTATPSPPDTPTSTETNTPSSTETSAPTDTPTSAPTSTETSAPTSPPTGTPVNTATSTPVSTATPAPPPCVGDCNGDDGVTVNELLIMVNVALGNADVSACTAGDVNNDGMITINEIIVAVGNALNGCGG